MSSEKHITRFSIKEAISLSLKAVRRRSMKRTLTLLSITSGSAFISMLLTVVSILQMADEKLGTYQYWILIVAILVWEVAIVNSVLISMAERSREIGIMENLGATNPTIIKILLIESAIFGLLGGSIGAATGWLIGVTVYGLQLNWSIVLAVPPQTYLFNFALTVTVSVLLSMVTALYPISRATKLVPADALRREI